MSKESIALKALELSVLNELQSLASMQVIIWNQIDYYYHLITDNESIELATLTSIDIKNIIEGNR